MDRRPEPVDLATFAALAGLTYDSFKQYSSAGMLPPPDGVVGRSPWWWPETVHAWIDARAVHSTGMEGQSAVTKTKERPEGRS